MTAFIIDRSARGSAGRRCPRMALRLALAATLSLAPYVASGLEKAAEKPAGSEHTCAVVVAGGVKCWGANGSGQLGDGTHVNRNAPVDVSGLSGGVAAVVAGSEHTCAMTTAGAVGCWGANASGQLGDGSNVNRSTVVNVPGLSGGVTAIAAGSEHTCAVVGGGVKCWGANASGQLGDGTRVNRNTPVTVPGLSAGVTGIVAGSEHTCALTTTGAIWCWGANASGQLGDGTNVNRNAPVNISGLPGGVAAIVAGSEHTCAQTSGGVMGCWGANASGQLGDATNVNRNAPVNVAGLSGGVAEIAAGSEHTCALTRGGTMGCWGANASGQLGDGTHANRNVAVNVSGLSGGVTAIVAGSEHTCAMTTGGAVACWGANASGQLGDGTNANRAAPTSVPGLPTVRPSVRWRIL
jgi:alpha-tubulin suppressor-like RCC1 family protein